MSAKRSSEHNIELSAVISTEQLHQRVSRRPNYEAETRALLSLARVVAKPPRDILQQLVETAVELCQAGSAGVSIIEDHFGEPVFRWHALTGALASHRWGTTPRDFSPCGIVIDRNAVQLMSLPERHFRYFADVKPPIVEALLVPFAVRDQPVGTIWAVTHDDKRKFDSEDERLMKELGQFATEAYQLASSVEASKTADRRQDRFVVTLSHDLRKPSAPPPLNNPASLEECANRTSKAATLFPQMAAEPDAALLLQRMRAGDQPALEQLYDCTVGSLYALAKTILESAEDAKEVVCETYLQAWQQRQRFDAERSSPIGWLMTICRTRALERFRHNRSRDPATTVASASAGEPAADAFRPEALLGLFRDGSRVQCALAALGPQRLELVGLIFFEGLSYAEMAERTGMPLAAVKSQMRRALAWLRRQLK